MPRRRVALGILAALLAGAFCTAAVAWLCAFRAKPGTTMTFQGGLTLSTPGRSTFSRQTTLKFPSILSGPSPPGFTMSYDSATVNSSASGAEVSLTESAAGTPTTYTYSHSWKSGWPFRSMQAWNSGSSPQPVLSRPPTPWGLRAGAPVSSVASAASPRFPFIPLFPGFLYDTLLYAAAIWLPFAAIAFVRRRRRGHCSFCNYDLAGNTTGFCPECGRQAPAAAA